MKKVWIVLTVIAALLAGAYLYFHLRGSKDFEPQIKQKLKELVEKSSNGLYKLDLESIDIDITNSTVTANNVLLSPDSVRAAQLEQYKQLPNDLYTVSLKKLLIRGLSPLDFLHKQHLSLTEISVDSPDVQIVHKKRDYTVSDTGNFYSRVVKNDQSWKLDKLLLQNIHLTVKNLDKNNQVSYFKNLNAYFTDILIDSTTRNDSTRFLFAKDAMLTLKDYATITPNKRYHFNVDSISLKPQQDSLRAFGIRLKPIGDKDAFSKKLEFLTDRYDLYIKEAAVEKTRWWSLLAGDDFYAVAAKVSGGYIQVYDDRRLPTDGSKVGNYPHQLLTKMKFPVFLAKLSVHDFRIRYEEFNPKSGKTGFVEFNDVYADATNITNIKESIAKAPILKVSTRSKLMNAGDLKATFTFDLQHAEGGNFALDFVLGTMDGTKLNKAVEGLGLFSVRQLTVDKLETHMRGENMRANATVSFAYHNLKVDVLKGDGSGDLKKKGFISLVANTFFIKDANPAKPGKELRGGDAFFERDPHKSFFNLIWKTIAKGMEKAVKGKPL